MRPSDRPGSAPEKRLHGNGTGPAAVRNTNGLALSPRSQVSEASEASEAPQAPQAPQARLASETGMAEGLQGPHTTNALRVPGLRVLPGPPGAVQDSKDLQHTTTAYTTSRIS